MNELRQKRKELGLTQEQVAKVCGVSRRTYQTYEETENRNSTCEELLRQLTEMGVFDGSKRIVSVKAIKLACQQLFEKDYPEIGCVYLFGSYARGEANGKSDIDLMVVCPPIGMKLYGISVELEEKLHKKIDLHTHRQLLNNEQLLSEILKEGIKIYESKNIATN